MFAYDVSIWKHKDRLEAALTQLDALKAEMATLAAPHIHELVRLKETDAMVLATELILRASLLRTESRVSHFREDFDFRDDENWLCWVDIREENGAPVLSKTPIPTPFHAIGAARTAPIRRAIRGASAPR